MDLKETECEDVILIHLAHHTVWWRALVNMVMNLWVPKMEGNFLTSWATVSFWRLTLLHLVTNIRWRVQIMKLLFS